MKYMFAAGAAAVLAVVAASQPVFGDESGVATPRSATPTTVILFMVNTEETATTVTVDRDGKGLSAGDYQVFQESVQAADSHWAPILGVKPTVARTFCMYDQAPGGALCTSDFGLGGGNSLTLAGQVGPNKQTLAVTGGTGTYASARGEAVMQGTAGNPVTKFKVTVTTG